MRRISSIGADHRTSTNLDSFGIVNSKGRLAGLWAASLVLLALGLNQLEAKYSDFDFASEYLWTELVVAVLVSAAVMTLPNKGIVGFQRPRLNGMHWSYAFAATVAIGAVGFVLTWSTMPDNASVDGTTLVRSFVTLLLVGFTEEVMYRGFLLVALTHLFGFRSGLALSAFAFGLLHSINVFGGQGAAETIQQVLFTWLLGYLFIGLVLATRSIWPAIVLHALYDFFLIGGGVLENAGAEVSPALQIAMIPTVLVAIYGIKQLRDEPPTFIYQRMQPTPASPTRHGLLP